MPKIINLPSDTVANPNDYLIIEDSVTGTTRKILISDFITSTKIVVKTTS